MTDAQKRLRELRERQSKQRQRMAELARVDELTVETRAELDKIEAGTPDLERQIRAATLAVEDEDREAREAGAKGATQNPDPETRERIELRSRASLGSYLLAAARGRMVDGAEAELSAAARVNGIPLELWDVPEQRAVSPAPSTVGINLDPIRPMVFSHSIAARLGIDMPRVPSGTFATGTITQSTTAGARAKSADSPETAAAITVTTATAKRVSARLALTLEDIASIGAENFESILRQNLALALSDELDKQVINGDGTAPNLTGLLARLTTPAEPSNVAAFDSFVATFADGIDGLWASTVKDVAIVAGVDTYKLAAKTFRDAAGADLGDTSFADYAMAHFGGWWTNKRMPDASANNIQAGILYRAGRSMMGGSGAMRTAVCPHWGEVQIDDIYSGSTRAERFFTLHVLLGDVILVQEDAYAEVAFKVA